MKNIIFIFIACLGLFAQDISKKTEFNFCTYVAGAKAIDIGKSVSVKEIKEKKEILENKHIGYDMYYYKVEYKNNIVSKVSMLTLVTNQLLEEFYFNDKGFLIKRKIYKNNSILKTCNISYDFKKKKAIEKCDDSKKTISYYKDFNKDSYKLLFFNNGKYIGKTVVNYKKGTLIRYNSKNKIIFKSDEMSTYVDTCGTLVKQGQYIPQ